MLLHSTKAAEHAMPRAAGLRPRGHTDARVAAPHLVRNHSEQANRYCRFSMLSVSCTGAPARVLGEPADGDRRRRHGRRDASRGDDTPPGGRTSHLGDLYPVEQPSAVRCVPENVLRRQRNLTAHSLFGSSDHDARTTAPCLAGPAAVPSVPRVPPNACGHGHACAMPNPPQSS